MVDLIPEKIRDLDLIRVASRLHTEKGWDEKTTATAIERYRGFLTLASENVTIAPTADIDEVWHAHILETRAYAEDTERILGRFLHHNPTLEEFDDPSQQSLIFAETSAIWESRFGVPYAGAAGMCNNGGCDGGSCNGSED